MKLIYRIGIFAIVTAGLLAAVYLNPIAKNANTPEITESNIDNSPQASANTPSSADGRYIDYDTSLVSSSDYNKTILFFHAPWCPECRAFEKAITSSTIPDGVQILKVDYDSSSELKKKYGVTLQTTFVRVGSEANKLSLWVGYSKEKTIDIILENT